MKRILLFILLLNGWALYAQQGFTFVRFLQEDGNGLSGNEIYSVYQDQKGFIWIGTANGLQRFDGSKFTHVQSRRQGPPLSYSSIYELVALKNHTIALNYGDKLGIFNTETYRYAVPSLPADAMRKRKGKILSFKDETTVLHILVPGYGLLKYNSAANRFEEDKTIVLPPAMAAAVETFFVDNDREKIWFGGPGGVFVLDRVTNQWKRNGRDTVATGILAHPAAAKDIKKIFIDSKRRHWFITSENDRQVQYCLDSNGRFLKADTLGMAAGGKTGISYDHFFESPKSGFWIYGKQLLLNWDKYSRQFHYNRSSERNTVNRIEYEMVNDVVEDRDGNLWIATDRGLYFTSFGSGSFSIVNYLVEQTQTKDPITGILQMPNDDFWLSTHGSGVIGIDRHLVPIKIGFYRSPPPAGWSAAQKKAVTYARSICLEKKTGKVWIGCDEGVLVTYHPASNRTQYYLLPGNDSTSVTCLREDAEGRLWLGTSGGTVYRRENDFFETAFSPRVPVTQIIHGRGGLAWVATNGRGVFVFEYLTGKLVGQYAAGNDNRGLASDNISDIEELSDSLVVAGGGGLSFINRYSREVNRFTFEDGLPSNDVQRLRADSGGILWIITANGLCRFDAKKKRVTSYGRRDGVTLAYKTTAADIISGNGLMIFAGNNAVMMFKPYIFSNKQAPPNVVITDFKLFNEDMPLDSLLQLNQIKLAPGQNSFSIYYSSISFQQQDRLTYYYRMEGIDQDWKIATDGHFQNYPLLPPGRYRFQVYAENVEGQRSPQVTELNIFIKAPYWRRPWFYALMVILVAALLYGLHRLRINRLLAVEKIRSRVARDLHDDMGSTLSTINILSSMVKTKMNNDNIKAAEYLGKISENSQQMMEAMDDIVWSIKPDNDSMHKLVARIRAVATDLLEPKEIKPVFAISNEVQELKLNMEQRRDCFLLIKEAINNAAKYSRATQVLVQMQVSKNILYIQVRDDGIGFTLAEADSGNGLGNMKKRADNLGATYRLLSTPGKGSAVELEIPIK